MVYEVVTANDHRLYHDHFHTPNTHRESAKGTASFGAEAETQSRRRNEAGNGFSEPTCLYNEDCGNDDHTACNGIESWSRVQDRFIVVLRRPHQQMRILADA